MQVIIDESYKQAGIDVCTENVETTLLDNGVPEEVIEAHTIKVSAIVQDNPWFSSIFGQYISGDSEIIIDPVQHALTNKPELLQQKMNVTLAHELGHVVFANNPNAQRWQKNVRYWRLAASVGAKAAIASQLAQKFGVEHAITVGAVGYSVENLLAKQRCVSRLAYSLDYDERHARNFSRSYQGPDLISVDHPEFLTSSTQPYLGVSATESLLSTLLVPAGDNLTTANFLAQSRTSQAVVFASTWTEEKIDDLIETPYAVLSTLLTDTKLK